MTAPSEPLEGQVTEVDRTSSIKAEGTLGSPWVTLLIFLAISAFNPEVLTGSTPIEKYLTPFNLLLTVPFYGLQVAVIADLAARYRLRWRTVYFLGLIYGILEEGFAVQTMLHPSGVGNVNVPPVLTRILGLNVAWTVYIDVFHSVVSVISTIIIVKLIWPSRVSEPFLHRKHYAVIAPILVAVYAVITLFVVSATHYVPEAGALVTLALACASLGYLVVRNQRRTIASLSKPVPARRYLFWALGLALGFFPLAIIVLTGTGLPVLNLPVITFTMAFAYLFSAFFGMMDTDPQLTQRKLLWIFLIFVGFWLVFPTFWRTPLSSLAAYLGIALQVYLARRSMRREMLQGLG